MFKKWKVEQGYSKKKDKKENSVDKDDYRWMQRNFSTFRYKVYHMKTTFFKS